MTNLRQQTRKKIEKLAHEIEAVKFDGEGNVNVSINKALDQIMQLLDDELINEVEQAIEAIESMDAECPALPLFKTRLDNLRKKHRGTE